MSDICTVSVLLLLLIRYLSVNDAITQLSDITDGLICLQNIILPIQACGAYRCDAFQAQQNNLVQVARRLGQAVPLSPQLIFTPTATVTAVQSENSTQASSLVGAFETYFGLQTFI